MEFVTFQRAYDRRPIALLARDIRGVLEIDKDATVMLVGPDVTVEGTVAETVKKLEKAYEPIGRIKAD